MYRKIEIKSQDHRLKMTCSSVIESGSQPRISNEDTSSTRSRSSALSFTSVFDVLANPIVDLNLPIITSIVHETQKKTTILRHNLRNMVCSGQGIRWTCIVGLVAAWILSAVAITFGVLLILRGRPPLPTFLSGMWMTMGFLDIPFPPSQSGLYIRGHMAYSLFYGATITIPFLLNLGITALLDCLNCIQATTLRWALLEKSPPHFNSNPRFFVSSTHPPSHWITNIVSVAGNSMSYGAISLLSSQIYLLGVCDPTGYNVVTTNIKGPRYGLDFNGWALLLLGISVLVNACISTWTLLYDPRLVKSWNTDPIVNAIIIAGDFESVSSNSCRHSAFGEEKFRSHRCLQFISKVVRRDRGSSAIPLQGHVLSGNGNGSRQMGNLDVNRQQSAITMVRHLRFSRILLWTIAVLIVVWLVVTAIFAVRTGATTPNSVYQQTNRSDFSAFWKAYGLVYILYYNPNGSRRDWLGVVIQTSVQSMLTLGLHAADNIVNVAKDELRWRELGSTAGARINQSWLEGVIASRPTILLTVLKAVIQWTFGYAFTVNLAIWMALLPILVLAVSSLVLAAFGEWIVRWRPQGPQLATYGNLSLMARLIIEGKLVQEGEKLYWEKP